MKSQRKIPISAGTAFATFAACLAALGQAAHAQSPHLVAAPTQSYTVTDLGSINGKPVDGTGINSSGQVVSTSYSAAAGSFQSVLTGPAGMAPLRTFGVYSQGRAVNATGQVAGQAINTTTFNSTAFLSGPQGGPPYKDLGALGGHFSFAIGVNSSGQVSGTATIYDNNTEHAFLSGTNGGPLKDLGTLGGTYSFGVGVNDQGQVSGTSFLPAVSSQFMVQHAFLSGPNGGPLKDLGVLGGTDPSGILSSTAGRVNAYGQVTGYSQRVGHSGSHAFLSGRNGGLPLVDLGTLSGDTSAGNDVNASGVVVGASAYPGSTGQYDTHAFVYVGGTLTDLNNFIDPAAGIVLTEGRGISDTGFILAAGTVNGEQHTFVLTPTLAPPVNLGPRLTVAAVASPLDAFGIRYVTVSVTNVGGIYADQVVIAGISVNGLTPILYPAGDIHNVLPTIPNLLSPGVTETDTVAYPLLAANPHSVVTVSGTYIDPVSGGLGHFSGSARIVLP